MLNNLKDQTAPRETIYTAVPVRKRASKALLPLTFVAVLTALGLTAVTTSAASAQGANPMDAVAEALDVGPEQLKSCLGEPPAQGKQPSEADRAAATDCLIDINPSLTPDQIDAAMEKMRSGPPPKK